MTVYLQPRVLNKIKHRDQHTLCVMAASQALKGTLGASCDLVDWKGRRVQVQSASYPQGRLMKWPDDKWNHCEYVLFVLQCFLDTYELAGCITPGRFNQASHIDEETSNRYVEHWELDPVDLPEEGVKDGTDK